MQAKGPLCQGSGAGTSTILGGGVQALPRGGPEEFWVLGFGQWQHVQGLGPL